MTQRAGIIAAGLDWAAALQIEKGVSRIAQLDKEFRIPKEVDHDMGL